MDFSSGQLGKGGADLCAAEIRFMGLLGPPFIQFALARGRRLSLSGSIEDAGDSVVVALEGPAALIDAFEVTCSLGPIGAHIKSWIRTDLPLDSTPREFSLRF